ncbi:MAG: hypothetical protein C6H99_05930 [Epsilonproteobacteria bacterium]|nr:hypothetical protein [Campylobacterota bacterium]NPA64018.1 hypothetical protein [Campylobacterota bacterium]
MRVFVLTLLVFGVLFGRNIALPGSYDEYPYQEQYGASSSCEASMALEPYKDRYSLTQQRAFKDLYYKIVEGKWLYKRLFRSTKAKYFYKRKKELNYWIAKLRKEARRFGVALDLRNEALQYSPGFSTTDLRKAFYTVLRYEQDLHRLLTQKQRYLYSMKDILYRMLAQNEEAQQKLRCVVDML